MAYSRLGKYDDGTTEALDTLIGLHQWGGESDGNTEWGTHFTALNISTDDTVEHFQLLTDLLAEIDDELTPAVLIGHWIVEHDSQGFVFATHFEHEHLMEIEFSRLQEAYGRWETQLEDGTQIHMLNDHVYDRTLTITTEDVGEVGEHVDDDGRMAVYFQELEDEEGVTPCVYLFTDELEVA